MDIQKICAIAGIPFASVARRFFPSHSYPEHALKYLSKSDKELTRGQIAIIEELACRSMEELQKALRDYPDAKPSNGWSWKPTAEKSAFYRGDYRIDYYPHINAGYVYHKGELISDHLLVSSMTPHSVFLSDMEKIIASHEANKNR